MRTAVILLCLIIPGFAIPANAKSDISMVKEIIIGSEGGYPSWETNLGGLLFFFADDGIHGRELWRSDGTAAGTYMLKDIYPGPESSTMRSPITAPGAPLAAGGCLYFVADDGVHGSELWRSDGTADGTRLLKDTVTGPVSGGPQYLAELDGTVYFAAGDDVSGGGHDTFRGNVLWRSDGSMAGTSVVKDIFPGSTGEYLQRSIARGASLFFGARNEGNYGLWRSDGTEPGTTKVAVVGGEVHNLTDVNGNLYFSSGNKLWRSDGTEGGTFIVKNLFPGQFNNVPSSFTELNGLLYYVSGDGSRNDKLWRSDGTEAGTYMVTDVKGELMYVGGRVFAMNSVLYFPAFSAAAGLELWRSDGTATGTSIVRDINPATGNAVIEPGAVMNDRLYFFANDGIHGKELWRSDGTLQGTTMVRDTISGPMGLQDTFSASLNITEICGALFFNVKDDVHGHELWKYEPYSFIPISLTANGDGELTSHSNAAGDLEVAVSIDPLKAAGVKADWWLEAVSPGGRRFWYDRTDDWMPSASPRRAYGGPLTKVAGRNVVISSRLPAGLWQFDFSVDLMDGVQQKTLCDTVGVVVTP